MHLFRLWLWLAPLLASTSALSAAEGPTGEDVRTARTLSADLFFPSPEDPEYPHGNDPSEASPPSSKKPEETARESKPPSTKVSRGHPTFPGRYLDVHALAFAPVLKLWQPSDKEGRGIWNQPVAGIALEVRPIENLYADLTLLVYPDGDARESWNPDFTYSFGYNDWRPNTFFLTHANYTANRYPWRATSAEPVADLLQGVTSGGWKYQMPASWRDALAIGKQWWLGGSLAVHYAARYSRPDGSEANHQFYTSLGLGFTVHEHGFAELRAFLYPIAGQQQPWDPDFTYSLGWMGWGPWNITLRWNNYTGNRWPGHKLEGNGDFRQGVFFVSLQLGG